MPRYLPGSTVAEKLRLNSVRDGSCLRWTGAHIPTGYGQLRVGDKRYAVHRLAYILAFGELDDSLDIDHVATRGCRFRDCIEPSHLEAVTHAENLRRGPCKPQTICPQGHPLSGENLIARPTRSGGVRRVCRICINESGRRSKAKRRLARQEADRA